MYKKIASNTIAQIFSKILTAFISIFLIGILTKYLPIELYGSYNKVYSYLGIFAFLADLWLYTIAIREISQGKTSTDKIIGNILTLRTWLGLIIWWLALIIAMFLPWYNDFLTLGAIGIVGVFTIVSLINSSLLALMQSQMKMEFSLFSVVAWKLVNITLIALFLVFLFSENTELAFHSVFIAWLIWIIINTILNYIYAKKIVPIKYRFDWEYIAYIFKISLPYGIALFLSVVYFKIDVILLSLLESPEQANISIALYGLPMKIVEVLMVLWGFYLNSLLPTLSEKYTQKKYEEISHILWISLKVLISFWVLIFTLWNLLAVETIAIIATPEYLNPIGQNYNSVQAFSIVLGVLLFHFISLAFIYILIASERQSILLKVNLFVTLVNIIGNILLIPHYSFIGAAIITLLSQVILMCITWWIILRKITIPIKYLKSIWWTFIYAGILFFLFQKGWTFISLGNIWTILSITPIFIFFYVWWEYILSRKIINQLR